VAERSNINSFYHADDLFKFLFLPFSLQFKALEHFYKVEQYSEESINAQFQDA